MYNLHASTCTSVLPTFADQGSCPQFDPKGDEAQVLKTTLLALVANTRLNQAISIHPTTDLIAERIDAEREQILEESTRDFLSSYDDPLSFICLRRKASVGLVDYLTQPKGSDAIYFALMWTPTGNEIEADNTTSLVPMDDFEGEESESGTDHSSDEDVELEWPADKLEEARNFEPDAGAGSYDVGFVNSHDAEGIDPADVNPNDQKPVQTCGHGTDYQQHCSDCEALCEYFERREYIARALGEDGKLCCCKRSRRTQRKRKRRKRAQEGRERKVTNLQWPSWIAR